MVRALQIVGVGALGIIGQSLVDSGSTFAGLEKLGVAAVTIALMFWLLKQERDERRTTATRLDALQEEIRKERGVVIANHADAMRENAKAQERHALAQERMTEVLGKVLEKVVKG